MTFPEIQIPPPGPKAKPWIERAKAAMSSPPIGFPTLFTECDGVHLKDIDGNHYITLTGSSRALGFRHPEMVAAARDQMNLTGVGKPPGIHPNLVLLAEKLKEIAPPSLSFRGKVGFSNTGSDITEAAMMLVRGYTNKQVLFAFLGAVHGCSSIGVRSLSSDQSINRRYYLPLVPSIELIPYPHCYRCVFNQEYPGCGLTCLDFIQYTFDTAVSPQETAAFFIEPIQGYEVKIPPKEYFPKLKKLCEEHGILIVDDEVITGFGRTGTMWGLEHFGIEPDIIYMAKSIANGISMSALIGTSEVMEQDTQSHFVHGGAFRGNPIACTCALIHIELIQRENLIDNANEVGAYIRKRFHEFAETHELIGDVRGKGVFIGVELVKDQKSKQPATKEATQLVSECFKRGVIIQNTGTYKQVLRLTAPMILTKDVAETGLNIVKSALNEVERNMR